MLTTMAFSLMSLEEKNEIKRLVAHRPNDVQIKQKDTRLNRSFLHLLFRKERLANGKRS